MTTDLDRLIEAVGAGTQESPPWRTAFGWDETLLCENAYRGSLDAAVRLLEALLPDYGWEICCDGRASVFTGEVSHGSRTEEHSTFSTRALLLATLRAYRSTREGE